MVGNLSARRRKKSHNMKIITYFELNEHENSKDNSEQQQQQQQPKENLTKRFSFFFLLNVFFFFSFLSRKDINSQCLGAAEKINGNLSCHVSRAKSFHIKFTHIHTHLHTYTFIEY